MKITDIKNRDKFLCQYLNENNLTEVGVEVGVKRAQNARRILKNWNGKQLYLVDTWPRHDIKDDAIRNLQPYIGRYKLIHNSSLKALAEFEDNNLDFCYIDASHAYTNVIKDINNWWLKVKPGGILAGHDYELTERLVAERLAAGRKPWPHIGVRKAVDEFVKENDLKLHIDAASDVLSWYINKLK